MPPLPLIYHSPNPALGVDTCEPQKQAIAQGKIKFFAITHGHYPGTFIPPETLPGVSSIGYWDAVGEQDWGLEPHCNEGIELMMVETGYNAFVLDGVCHKLKAGSLTVTRPWELHGIGDPNLGPGRLYWIILDMRVVRRDQAWKWPPWVVLTPADRKKLAYTLRHGRKSVWKTTPEITQIFRSLGKCVRAEDPSCHASRIIALINLLLVALLDALRAQDEPMDESPEWKARSVEHFLKGLIQNPAALSERWTLQSMARHCGMGNTAFVQYCRKLTNTSPLDYLNRCRLDFAARRLRKEPDTPVTRIAFECGYWSSQYFASQFRRRHGCSPSEYRQR